MIATVDYTNNFDVLVGDQFSLIIYLLIAARIDFNVLIAVFVSFIDSFDIHLIIEVRSAVFAYSNPRHRLHSSLFLLFQNSFVLSLMNICKSSYRWSIFNQHQFIIIKRRHISNQNFCRIIDTHSLISPIKCT